MSTDLTAPAAAPVEQEPRRKRAAWRPLAAAAIAGSVLVTTGFGVWASLSASATGVTQDVSTGTLTLALTENGAGFSTPISKLAPTDNVQRYVTLTNTGTLEGRDLKVSVAGTGDAVLLTGPKALTIAIESCASAWTADTSTGALPGARTCTTGATTVLPATTVSAVTDKLLSSSTLAATSGAAHLRVTTTLPNTDENSHNGVLPTDTVQGKNAKLTYTFNEVQRAGTTTSS